LPGALRVFAVLMLTNMLHYAEKQVEINKTLERATAVVKLQDRDSEKIHNPSVLPTNNDWEFKFLLHRFQTFSRLTITILIGFIIGALPSKCLLIVLTIVVIMRQGYGLTNNAPFTEFSEQFRCFIAFGVLFSSWLNNHWWISNHRTTFDFHLLQLITKFVHHHLCHLYLRNSSPDIDNLIQYRSGYVSWGSFILSS
jgi:hypothetical protein